MRQTRIQIEACGNAVFVSEYLFIDYRFIAQDVKTARLEIRWGNFRMARGMYGGNAERRVVVRLIGRCEERSLLGPVSQGAGIGGDGY